MTVGYLLDLFIINEVRKEKLKDSLEADVKNDLDKQNGFYLREIGQYLLDIADGKRPGVFSKHKNYDQGVGELSDAASALDYLQSMNNNSKHCWVAGFSFGAWVAMQLLMRRPEINGFVSVSPPANSRDFSFLAPCPSSGLIIHGDKDNIASFDSSKILVEKLQQQKKVDIKFKPKKFPLSGKDVINKGFSEGKTIGIILQKIKKMKIF